LTGSACSSQAERRPVLSGGVFAGIDLDLDAAVFWTA
jgi:hypothetical protein